jgi:hypothetical protein
VSTARYELRNVRRESLLPQNRTAPEEGTNASPDTEQEDTNALPFDHEMTKISTDTELKEWITAHGAGDIVAFIKYMCQQHDTEIETHNDMVQMLEDANEANTELEAQQTRLRKEMRDKDVIIRHLETAPSRQSTSAPEGRSSKSTKLPDPPLFEGPAQDVDNWLSRMRNKLKANKDHFPTEELKIAYIESRVSGAAAKHIAPRMRDTSLNPFLEAEEVLSVINKVYGDPNRRHTAQRQYLKLYQNKTSFHEFWMEFQRFSAELGYNNETLLDDLQHKISSDLQRATLNERTTDLNEFADICMRADVRLTELNARSAAKAPTTPAVRPALALQLLVHRHPVPRRQSTRGRNLEYRTSTPARKSCLRKDSASNARSQDIGYMNALRRLKCTRSLRIRKTTCPRQSSDWGRHTHILFHQHAWRSV